jgi:tetratricopeptide (TPR) repeat protein
LTGRRPAESIALVSSRVHPLDSVRADGWFEGIRTGSPNIERIIELVGELPLAFSIILGVQITSISIDPRNRDASLVDFAIGDDTEAHRMALGEFRRRIASSLADEPYAEAPLPEDPAAEDLERFIGSRTLLLAPLFGLSLRELIVSGDEAPKVRVGVGRTADELGLGELRQIIHERVLAEARATTATSAPFSIELNTIPKAEEASRDEDYERTVELLGAWPGPLSVLLRTAEGQQLSLDVRASLAHALGLLGTAYARLGQNEWAEEVMRLGIQWAQDGPVAGDLFRRLGESYAARDRGGEAIGILRRALSLGASQRSVLPLLASCYADRGKMVAAAACVDEAVSLGVPEDELAAARSASAAVLGDAWASFRRLVPAPSSRARTIRPMGPPPKG